MNTIRIVVQLVLFLSAMTLRGQTKQEMVKDLREEWLVEGHDGFIKFGKEPVRKIFLSLDAVKFKGDILCLHDIRPYALFVNNQLVLEKEGGLVKLSIDSLGGKYSTQLSISVYQRNGITSLATYISGAVSPSAGIDHELFPRKGNFFLDFSLLATLAVSGYLVFLLRTNPRLTFDYLNISKLFSAQEREESLVSGRVTSRVNLLFYFFCCLFCSLTLLVVFHLSKSVIPMAAGFGVRTTAEGFLQWIKLSVVLAGLLALKLVIVVVFSTLFRLRDKAPIQYLNFIRTLFLASGLIAVICTLNFVFNGQYGGLDPVWLKVGALVMILSAGMMYLKLLALTRYHFFHLFSYLCASEIIPLVILLKISLY